MENKKLPPILSIVGHSNSGKTTLMEKLISRLTFIGLRVGSIKHDVHGFEMDKPGKDSWRHKKAGAAISMISSVKQIGFVKDVDCDHSPDQLLPLFDGVDIILTEGYKTGPYVKIEVFRKAICSEPLFDRSDSPDNSSQLLALVTDDVGEYHARTFKTDQVEALAELVCQRFGLTSHNEPNEPGFKDQFTIETNEKGLIIKYHENSIQKTVAFPAAEALMLLDILKNEQETLEQLAKANSPFPFRVKLQG